MNETEAKKEFKKWIKRQRPKFNENPRKGEAIVEVFHTEIERSIFVGVDIDHKGKIVGNPTKKEVLVYPYAYIVKSNIEDYKDGDVVYLDDSLLYTRKNPEYELWLGKHKHERPNMQGVPPPMYEGGLHNLERYKFKKSKFTKESGNDEYYYQLPLPLIRGSYEIKN